MAYYAAHHSRNKLESLGADHFPLHTCFRCNFAHTAFILPPQGDLSIHGLEIFLQKIPNYFGHERFSTFELHTFLHQCIPFTALPRNMLCQARVMDTRVGHQPSVISRKRYA